jgi:hypothetical protein
MEKIRKLKLCKIKEVYRMKYEKVKYRIWIKVDIRYKKKLDCWKKNERSEVDCMKCRIF